jgi:KTSC domain
VTYDLCVFHAPDEPAVPAHQRVHVELEVIVVRALVILLAQLVAAPIVSETVETGERRVDLGTFECRDITRSTMLQRVCYDRAQQDLIVGISGRYDRYCSVPAATVERLLGAPSMGQFFNRNIRRETTGERFVCRSRERLSLSQSVFERSAAQSVSIAPTSASATT